MSFSPLVVAYGNNPCVCGHPLDYHRGSPQQCGWCPPHSNLRCACVTPEPLGSGEPIDRRYDKTTPPGDARKEK